MAAKEYQAFYLFYVKFHVRIGFALRAVKGAEQDLRTRAGNSGGTDKTKTRWCGAPCRRGGAPRAIGVRYTQPAHRFPAPAAAAPPENTG